MKNKRAVKWDEKNTRQKGNYYNLSDRDCSQVIFFFPINSEMCVFLISSTISERFMPTKRYANVR